MRVFNLTICFLLLMSLAYRVYSQSYDDSQAQLNYIGSAPIEPTNSDRVKRSEELSVDIGENNQVNQGEGESGQNENNSSAEDDSSGDETDGNTSDDEGNEDDMEQDDRATKQKRHMMDNYIPQDGELQKLMEESSGLAEEVGQVFELLSDREVKLFREMAQLKDALSMAVSKLKTSLQAEVTELDDKEKARRQRSPYNKPYKACVSIEPSPPDQQYIGLGQIPPRGPPGVGTLPSPTPKVLEFIPGKGDPIITPSPPRIPISRQPPPPEAKIPPRGSQGDQVDLSQVVWVRLNPERKQEELKKKIDSLLKEKQNLGKDVLVIPVDHSLRNTEEVKSQFLHAVRVKPSALKNHNFRQLRSLKIEEY